MSSAKVMILGNVGQAPVCKDVNGQKALNFSVATSERYTNKAGEKVENTHWHNCSAWGKTAEFIEKYFQKGSGIFVTGDLINRKYTNKDGVEVTTTEVKVSEVDFVGGAKPQTSSSTPPPAGSNPPPPAGKDDDDLPF